MRGALPVMACVANAFLLALSGCFGGCSQGPPGPPGVQWQAAGLFEQMPRTSADSSLTISEQPPQAGFAIVNATLDDQYGKGNWTLVRVGWKVPTEPNVVQDSFEPFEGGPDLAPPGIVSAFWYTSTDNATILSYLERFIDNITSAPAKVVGELADAFLRNATRECCVLTGDTATGAVPLYHSSAQVDMSSHVRVDLAWQRFYGRDPAWTFDLSLATIAIRSSDGWGMSTSADDWGRFDAPSDASDDEAFALFNETVARFDLPLGDSAPKIERAQPSRTCY